MDLAEFFNLQDIPDIMPDLAELVPVEVLPVLPVPLLHAVGWVTRLMVVFSRHALLLAFFGAFIENTVVLGFLLPGGTVVALSGAAGRTANVSLPWLIIASGLGMTAGAVTNYYCGRAGLQRVLARPWTGKIGRELAHQLRNAEPLLRKHGWWVMLFAHAFGPGRSTLALAAGASGFSLLRFLVIELPAAFLWSALYAGGGFLLASEWQNLELLLRRIGWAGGILLVVGCVGYWFWRKKLAKPDDAGETAPSESHNGKVSWPPRVEGDGAELSIGGGRRRSDSP